MAFYGAFWALSIRRALSIPLYRNQALGIALVALAFYIFYAYTEIPIPALENINGPVGFWLVTFYPAFLVIFYWVDVSARAARRSDPLLRDTLRWSRIRRNVWVAIFAIVALYTVSAAYNQLVGITGSLSDALTLVGLMPIFGTLAFAAVILPIGERRSGDHELRTNLRWFGLFALAVFLSTIIAAITYPFHHSGLGLLSYLGLPIGAYCLYRSARSLVPLNRITLE